MGAVLSNGFAGGCLCGRVTWRCEAEPMMVGHCHCVDCRKSSGTGHATHVVVPADALHVEGELRFYDRPADSGNLVSRGFCPACGSQIYSLNAAMPGLAFLRASSFDEPGRLVPQMVVYASRAPAWDHVDPSLPAFAVMPEGGPGKGLAESA